MVTHNALKYKELGIFLNMLPGFPPAPIPLLQTGTVIHYELSKKHSSSGANCSLYNTTSYLSSST